MTIDLDRLEGEATYGNIISELEGQYARKITKGFMNVVISINPFTRWLWPIRKREAGVFARNADMIATATNGLQKFVDRIASINETEMDLTEAVRERLGNFIPVRHIPDLGDNYRYVLAVYCFVADYAIRKKAGESVRALNMTISDLDAVIEQLADIKQSHESSSRFVPPKVIKFM